MKVPLNLSLDLYDDHHEILVALPSPLNFRIKTKNFLLPSQEIRCQLSLSWRMVGSVSSDGTPIIVLTTSDIPFDAISGNYKLKECILNSTAAQESNPAFRPDQKPWEENLAENPHNRNSPHGLQGANRVGVPDGGMRAWLVVLGGFSNLFVLFGKSTQAEVILSLLSNILLTKVCIGIMNSFGTFQTRYETLWRDRSTASITWIGSIQVRSCLDRTTI